MKPITGILSILFVGMSSLTAGELKIEWVAPEDYRDADYYYNGGDRSKEIVLTNLEKYFTREAKRRFPEGLTLNLTVTELDLAGDFEPWHNPSATDVRIVKDIYPAYIEFDYQLVDADGNVVKEGTESLKDRMIPDSLSARFLSRTESYPYVKTLVSDWMRKLAKSSA